jgi:hypothetical protein
MFLLSFVNYIRGLYRENSNKQMVPTLPARGNFYIRARHKSLGGGFGCVLPLKARVGRTFEALGHLTPC